MSVPEFARDKLKSFVERVERLEEEIAGLNGDKRDLYAEAKGQGFDVKAVKRVVAYRRKDPDEAREADDLFDTYLHAVQGTGTLVATRARAREPEPRPEPRPVEVRPVPVPAADTYADCPDMPEFLDRRPAPADGGAEKPH